MIPHHSPDDDATILFHAAAATADPADEPRLLEEIIRDGLPWREALRLLPRIAATARAMRAAGLGAALAAGAALPAAAMAIPPALPDAPGGDPATAATFAPLAFALLLGLASACGALVVALVVGRIERESR